MENIGPKINFSCKPFSELRLTELYQCMALRQAIFVVEQDCPYIDADGLDLNAWHLMGYDETGELATYARLLPKGSAYPDYASFGRVVSSEKHRRKGLGKLLMKNVIIQMSLLFGTDPIKISAQSYLISFYESFGFETTGQEYLEDNIPHMAMIKQSN